MLFEIPWDVACQVCLSMEFSRQDYWNGLLFPSLGDLPDQGIKPGSPVLQFEPPGKYIYVCVCVKNYYITITRIEIMPFAATWMDLEIIILSEVSQTEKYHMISFICGIQNRI